MLERSRTRIQEEFNGVESALVKQRRADRQVKLEVAAEGKNPAAVALGRLGGIKGGKARAAKLTAAERSKIAREAALARWHGERDS